MSTLGYGGGVLALPDALDGWPWLVGEEPPPLPDPTAAIDGALRRPDGAPALGTFVEPGDRVAVVLQTEIPAPLRELCISRVEEVLGRAGCAEISWLEASGRSDRQADCTRLSHGGGHGPDESWRGLRVEHHCQSHGSNHHAAGCGHPDLERGHPGGAFEAIGVVREIGVARIAAPIRRGDKLILIGVGSFDPLAGFSGGAGLVAKGCADPATARALLQLGIETGAERLQEAFGAILEILPPAFLIQLELQRGDRLAAVFAGDPRRAFAASIAFHRKWHERELADPLDLVLASAGGAQEDRDLSAALPSLLAAASALRPAGALIFAAACPAGLGALSEHGDDPGKSFLARILRRILAGRRCWLISEGLSESEISPLGLSLVPDVETALDAARREGLRFDGVAILEGSSTMPALTPNQGTHPEI